MAATNEAVHAADKWVNLALFISVGILCLLTFRSLRLTLCVLIPLALVTVLCNALMAMLGIGLKVNTLPVVALGVGVGVDYGIYLFERIKHEMQEGMKLVPASLADPGIVRLDHFGNVIIRQDLLRHRHAPACDMCIWHSLLLVMDLTDCANL